MASEWVCVDGNEAAARVAHRLSEVIAIYPITPASVMGELADLWSAQGHTNLWGSVPEVIEMQSEGGAAGALHGAIQEGALATTFTSSQGLLLMLPNMFKIAGQLLPCVIHVAARSLATHALSIFGDHSDVMSARTTGFAMLASSSVQEAQDLALVAHVAALRSRVPFLHFFDGFRTSHEINKIELLSEEDLASFVDANDVLEQHKRRLTPDRPVLRGSAQNPDVFFQGREAVNSFYDAVGQIVQQSMDALAARVGRSYRLVEFTGAPDAERVVVLMGSGVGAAEETVEKLHKQGEKVGLIKIRLYRPFPSPELLDALPRSVRSIAVLDRTKEPGSAGEPLYQDVLTALREGQMEGSWDVTLPRVIGGRYGLGSKEFTPAMVKGIFEVLREEHPLNHFSVGINDDVTRRSLAFDPDFSCEVTGVQALFFGLGSDGTVGASKSSVKIIGEHTDLHAQGYFVYDSKKSGAVTTSHLRFGPDPIRATYLIERADFVACHHFGFIEKLDVSSHLSGGGTLLLNSPFGPEDVLQNLPREVQQSLIDKKIHFWVIDAHQIAQEEGLGNRINTIMQACFFSLSGVLPRARAIDAIKRSIEKAYGKRGPVIVERNMAAVDRAIEELREVDAPRVADSAFSRRSPVPDDVPEFVQRVTRRLLAGEGDQLPVSALPVGGTFPTGTARYEKRSIAQQIPIWDPSFCIDCGKCAMVCPHAAIRMGVYPESLLADAPEPWKSKPFRLREKPGLQLTIQVAPDDCTGCGVCVDVCPAKSKKEPERKSIHMQRASEHRDAERISFDFFRTLPELDRGLLSPSSVKGVQTREPLFEFSGACAGCGETPYLKLLTQLFGDRLLMANATGCSSIYGGNLPTTPWSVNREGRGPAWANSLFEDNAEFGLGMQLALENHVATARRLLESLAEPIGTDRTRAILDADPDDDQAIEAQRRRISELKSRLERLDAPWQDAAERLLELVDDLIPRSVWIVGGDGWAYDIGSAGLDHVLASGRNVNVLVLDTQVYSNTGGQASKATPRGAMAKFAASGKPTARKDLGLIASSYGNVYVAQIAIGADDRQTLTALREAHEWPGVSLVVAYSTCIAHGIDMSKSMTHQQGAVQSGFWPLYRYHPGRGSTQHPFHLDSRPPSIPLKEFTGLETRFAALERSDPKRAEHLLALAQADVDERWRLYRQLAGLERTVTDDESDGPQFAKG